MPIYEYRCQNGHQFEVVQGMSDDPVEACEECGAPVERVFHPVAVHFKGSGFYTTDYAKKGQSGAAATKDGDSSSSSSESKSESKSDAGSASDGGSGEKKSDSSNSDSGSATKATADD